MNAIINLKKTEYIYLFARDLLPNLECADIDRLENAIIETKDLEYIYMNLPKLSKEFQEILHYQ